MELESSLASSHGLQQQNERVSHVAKSVQEEKLRVHIGPSDLINSLSLIRRDLLRWAFRIGLTLFRRRIFASRAGSVSPMEYSWPSCASTSSAPATDKRCENLFVALSRRIPVRLSWRPVSMASNFLSLRLSIVRMTFPSLCC